MDKNMEAIDTENWMGKLPEKLHNVPLYSLAIPGTHNSFTYSIKADASFSPDEPELSGFPLKYMSCVTRPLTYKWVVCDESCCVKQLKDGIRYFDFRVAKKTVKVTDFHKAKGKDSIQYHIVHGMYGINVEKVLIDIYEFLKFHKNEVVLLDFQWLYDMLESDHQKLVKMISEIFGEMLCSNNVSLSYLTLDWMQKNNVQVLVFYRNHAEVSAPYIWPRSKIPNPWPNTADADELFRFLTSNYEKKREECFYVTQAILTPTMLTIIRRIRYSLMSFAKVVNPRLRTWLRNKIAGSGGINIVITDFYSLSGLQLPKTIINLNYKYLNQIQKS